MSPPLPKLRTDLDVMPSPIPEQPGLLLRDPFRYTDQILVFPPVLAGGLRFFDGASTDLDLRAYLLRVVGDLQTEELARQMIEALREGGFLAGPEFERRKARRRHEFAGAATRSPAHAGTAYPAEPERLHAWADAFFEPVIGSPPTDTSPRALPAADSRDLIGIAAPHVSPEGGRRSYAAAYRDLGDRIAGRTVIVLGTSHFGEPERFGLTRKVFEVPGGAVPVDTELVDELAAGAGDAIEMEDYCHAIEHSIEFQCLFLDRVARRAGSRSCGAEPAHSTRGDGIRILPILCGPFLRSLRTGASPQEDPKVARFFAALRELVQRHASRLFWVLGIDLAHVGARYGDSDPVRAEEGRMTGVRQEDLARLDAACRGQTGAFLDLAVRDGDPLRWCGLSPLYTFLEVVPRARGEVRLYEQWNIDPESVVSFAALAFRESPGPTGRPGAIAGAQ